MSPKQERQTATQRQAIRQERLNKERQKRTRLIFSVIGIAVLVVGAVYVINRISKPSAQDLVVITPNSVAAGGCEFDGRSQIAGGNRGIFGFPMPLLQNLCRSD